MGKSSSSISWWLALLPAVLTGTAMFLTILLTMRKRSWRDWKPLAKATPMPPEHVAAKPRTIRDLAIGEESYVDRWDIVTSQRGRRVFVAWDASLKEAPENPISHFAPLRIRRLERGFSITVGPGDEFRSSTVPWGWYAPVIEIVQTTSSTISPTQ
ncbi:MAG: hypothetical protein JO061_07545 [Acidobacteriaceae bacterium]|nr:hypothetical protein [Acidobacteriaceae bacterium]